LFYPQKCHKCELTAIETELRWAIFGPYSVWVAKSPASRDAEQLEAGSVDGVLDLVRTRGGRATSSRRVLLEVLFEARGQHLSVEELAEAIRLRSPEVHFSTIYRNLEELERLGVVAHTHLGHGPATYQLSSLAHAHFICEECGAMIEAPDELFRGLARTAKKRLGFSIDPRHFAIVGRCASCA
jgi:Fur family transcriptional regulator, ferric uptake regulator